MDHQHFLAGFLQNNKSLVWFVFEFFLVLDIDLDAALEALEAKFAIRDLDFLEAGDVSEGIGSKDGEFGGVGSSDLKRTNSNDRITHLLGSADLLPQLPPDSNPLVHNISNKCCSAGPSV